MRGKKKMIIALILVMALLLSACGSETDRSSDEVETTELDEDAMVRLAVPSVNGTDSRIG